MRNWSTNGHFTAEIYTFTGTDLKKQQMKAQERVSRLTSTNSALTFGHFVKENTWQV